MKTMAKNWKLFVASMLGMQSHSLCSVFSQEVGHGVALVISVASDKHLNKVEHKMHRSSLDCTARKSRLKTKNKYTGRITHPFNVHVTDSLQ